MQTTPTIENVTLSLPHDDMAVLRLLSNRMGWKLKNDTNQPPRSLCAGNSAESRRQMLERDMTPEQLYSVIAEEIYEIYANA